MFRAFLASILIYTMTMQASAQEFVRISPSDLQAADGQTLQSVIDAAYGRGTRRVMLEPGDYYNSPLTLTEKHSGLTIEAAEGRATIYGGVPLTGWREEGGLFIAQVPADIATPIRLLIVQGTLADRARYPQEGYLMHETRFPVRWLSTTAGGWERKPTEQELSTMQYRAGDIPASLSARNAEVTVFHMWDESNVPVKSIDRGTRQILFAEKLGHPAGGFDVHRYIIWNTAEGLTREGQFYHDRENGRLVYRPRPGESAGSLRAIVGTIESPVVIRGTPEQPARDITFRGVEIQASTVPMVPGGFGALHYPGAIQLEQVENCRVERVRVSNVAGQGISSGWGKRQANVTIENCEVSQCGAGGIAVGGSQVTIRGNRIHHIGVMFPSAIGISRVSDGIIENNHVHDCTYSAITLGGTVIVRRNLIERAMTQLYDGAAIYATSAKACVIEENVCRDIGGTGGYHRAGYYLDEQCDNCIVRRNVAINVDVPLHNHMSRNCTLENNVMVNDGDMKIIAAKCTDYTMRGNVVWTGGKLTVNGIDGFARWADNVVFSNRGEYEFARMAEYKPVDTTATPPAGTTIADPGFVDVAQRDLRYRADSPAKAMGLPELTLTEDGRIRQ